MKLAFAALLISSLCIAAECTPAPRPPPDDPDVIIPPPDGPDGPDAPRGCSQCNGPCDCACCVMAWHNVDGVIRCREALPTAKGKTCEHVCIDAKVFAGGELGIPVLCIQKATTLEQLQACGVCRP